MTRSENLTTLIKGSLAGYAAIRAKGMADAGDVIAEANLAAAVAHLIRTSGHRFVFDLLTRAADSVLANEKGWPC